MGRKHAPTCPDVGDLPENYSDRLSRRVPAIERPSTSDIPCQFPGPAEVTWYFPIDLPQTNPTGVFIPRGFSYAPEIDVILFFHGNKQGLWHHINDYWHGDVRQITLREDLNASGKNALLIAPTMGATPGYGGIHNADLGIFARLGGGNCFLDHVMHWLGKYDAHYADKKMIPHVRRVVLAGHSGGGNPIHAQMESMKARICEIWAFDIVYGNVDDWVAFAHCNDNISMMFFHATQSTVAFNDLVAQKNDKINKLGWTLDNLVTVEAGKDHYRVLTDHFPMQVKNTNCFACR
jgi:hypothetical protein